MGHPGVEHFPNPGINAPSSKEDLLRRLSKLRLLGFFICLLILWNGVCDLIYGYSPDLSGSDYFSLKIWETVRTAGGRSHATVMLAQTAGWLYPFYALAYYLWWVGMRPAGLWLSGLPCGLLAYAILMIGGIQHCGWAFLSVLSQAKVVTGCTDQAFYNTAETFILEHFMLGDLTALAAFYMGSIWHAGAIISGRTSFPRWFVLVSPLGALVFTLVLGLIMPAPWAGLILAPFGTWFMLIPCLAVTLWLGRFSTPKPDQFPE